MPEKRDIPREISSAGAMVCVPSTFAVIAACIYDRVMGEDPLNIDCEEVKPFLAVFCTAMFLSGLLVPLSSESEYAKKSKATWDERIKKQSAEGKER